MPQYDVSKIVVGGKLFDGGIQYLGAQISLEMVALGLSRYEDRNVLVTDLEGDINVSGGSGIVRGYVLIDLMTSMTLLRNSYMSIQIGKTNIKGNEIQKLSLPPIEANQVEVSGSKTTSEETCHVTQRLPAYQPVTVSAKLGLGPCLEAPHPSL